MPSNHLILCCPFLLLPSICPTIRGISSDSALHIKCPKYWSFNFSISPSDAYSGLISFRTGWFDLLAIQGTLKNLLQYHNSKASILWHSSFFMVQLSLPYMTTGKTIALTMPIFVSKVISLLFNMLSRFVCQLYQLIVIEEDTKLYLFNASGSCKESEARLHLCLSRTSGPVCLHRA